MTNREFEKYLSLYGPRFANWPAELRVQVEGLQESPTRLALLIEAQYVEQVLQHNRPVEMHSADFAARIVRTARATQQHPKTSLMETLRAALEFLVPHPAAAFASVLVLGLVAGMGMPDVGNFTLNPNTASHSNDVDDTGGML